MDKRTSARYPLKLSALYITDRGLPGTACIIRDVGLQGLRIRSRLNGHMEAGKKLVLKIPHPVTGSIRTALASLAWKRDVAEGAEYGFEAGLAFEEIAPTDRLALLEYAYTEWFKSAQPPAR